MKKDKSIKIQSTKKESNEEIPYEIVNKIIKDDKNEITTIIHMADIHIKNKRIDEYKIVFDRLYEKLLNYDKNKTIITIVGDILDEKIIIGEGIYLLGYFLNKLDDLNIPVIFIYGNHDMYQQNTSKHCILKSVLEGFGRYKNIYHFTKMGTYEYNNIMFVVSSVFQKNYIINYNSIPSTDKTTVYLFHGTIGGSVIFNNNKMKSTISLKDFDGYDYVLLGDIHKHQYFDEDKTRAYCGSLIQQSFGESNDYHGYIEYNIKNKTSHYIEIPNDYGYVTLYMKDNILEDISVLPKFPFIRIYHQNCEKTELTNVSDMLKKKYNATGIKLTSLDKKNISLNQQIINLDNETNFKDIAELYINKVEQLDENTKIKLLEILNDSIKKIIIPSFDGSIWKILKLDFKNIFIFGEKNTVNFDNFKDIVALLGKNGTGKSSFIDIILFILYEKTSRTDTKHRSLAINDIGQKNKSFYGELTIEMGDTIYVITRKGKVEYNKKGELSYDSDLMLVSYKKNSKDIKNLFCGKLNTNKLIESLFGSYDDLTKTTFMLQNQLNNFSSLNPSSRKDILESVCGLKKYELLDEIISEKIKQNKNNIKLYENEKNINNISENELEEQRNKLKKLNFELNNENRKLNIMLIINNIDILTNIKNKVNKEASEIISNEIKIKLNDIKKLSYIEDDKLYYMNDNLNSEYKMIEYIINNNLLVSETIPSLCDFRNQILICNELSKKTGEYETILNDSERKIRRNIELNKLLIELEKENNSYEIYKTIVSEDVPKIIINTVLSKIQELVNDIVSSISDYSVSIEVIETTTKRKDREINIWIEKEGSNKKMIEQCSGSEKFLVDLALRIALCSFSKTKKNNCMFIDEGFVSFDIDKLEQANDLFEILKKHFDFILIISHLEQIKHYANSHYNIEKNDQYSKICIKTDTKYLSSIDGDYNIDEYIADFDKSKNKKEDTIVKNDDTPKNNIQDDKSDDVKYDKKTISVGIKKYNKFKKHSLCVM